jgi:hypothetical protein
MGAWERLPLFTMTAFSMRHVLISDGLPMIDNQINAMSEHEFP